VNDRPLTLLDARQLLGQYATNFDSALNQAVERIHTDGTWPGLTSEVDLTSSVVDGILTLPEGYDVLLAAQINGVPQAILPISLEYSHAGPGNREAGEGGGTLVDLGLQLAGDDGDYKKFVRQYKVLFDLGAGDALSGLVKRKFIYLTQDDQYIMPGNIGALKNALLAINFEDEADMDRAAIYWKACYDLLSRSASQIRNGTQQTATFQVFGLGSASPRNFL
jgi:hypothetical protein